MGNKSSKKSVRKEFDCSYKNKEHDYYFECLQKGKATEEMRKRWNNVIEYPHVDQREMYAVFGDPYKLGHFDDMM